MTEQPRQPELRRWLKCLLTANARRLLIYTYLIFRLVGPCFQHENFLSQPLIALGGHIPVKLPASVSTRLRHLGHDRPALRD